MQNTNFYTAFDITASGYRQWTFPAFGLIFVFIGLILPSLIDSGVLKAAPHMKKWFPKFFLGFAVLWTAISFFSSFSDYVACRDSLLAGKSDYVEGIVTNFIPMPVTGHSMESFQVNGVTFSYSDYVITSGFNNTSSHGGPIKEGQYVRIWFKNNRILKLEIKKV